MALKQLPEDFKDFIRCLNSNNVRYLLVGGWAVGIYGNPGATEDIDFLVAIDSENLSKLQNALIKNKKASGRSMDIADAEKLEK
ncbi:MAG: hypothetical protein LBI42_07355 [Chitinispirillales bacterium]|jgi:hypothetical protein|nr:hypothetical protein [Chitinispirillales bacterium]